MLHLREALFPFRLHSIGTNWDFTHGGYSKTLAQTYMFIVYII